MDFKGFFTLAELGAESEDQFHPGFLDYVLDLRIFVNRKFFVSSGARSAKHNGEVGGKFNSLHIWDKPRNKYQKGCMAVDVEVRHPSFKPLVVSGALLRGWSVGINDRKHFLHLDMRTMIGMPQAVFSY